MNDIKFLLQHKGKEKTSVYLRYNITINGKSMPFIYSLGESIITDHWDVDNMRLKTKVSPRRLADDNRRINSKIDDYHNYLQSIIDDLTGSDSEINRRILKSKMDIATGKQKYKGRIGLVDHLNLLIENRETGRELTPKKGTRYRHATIKGYKHTVTTLQTYESKFRTVLYPEDIDMEFYHRFVSMMNDDGKSLNMIGGKIRDIKMIIRHLYKKGLTNNRIFENNEFRKLTETADTIYLNDDEVDVLWQLDDLTPPQEKARDLFLIGCYSGLRFTDYSTLVAENIVEGNLLKVVTDKLSQIDYIPIHQRVREIIDKYGGKPPKEMSNQKLNNYLKEVAIKAGSYQRDILKHKNPSFFERQIFRITKRGKVVEEVFEKWQKVQSHTARRSFATNAYLAGIDSISIMGITGHKTEESFLKYIKVTKKQNAVRMLQHNWFK